MKYKVGDKVRIKSIDWYNENKDEDGDVPCSVDTLFVASNKKYLGTIQTIERIFECKGRYTNNYVYHMAKIDSTDWTDEMIEGVVEEETKNWADTSIPDGPYTVTYDSPSMNDSMSKNNIHNEIILPKGYIFKDENGNVINATKIVLEKKKKEYPKTYEECCKILNTDDDSIIDISVPLHYNHLLISFTQLIICRDAYWKIAGEKMGLGKPWEPDWEENSEKSIITKFRNAVAKFNTKEQYTFAFPTEEMRDAFYENFKELIEQCKELL